MRRKRERPEVDYAEIMATSKAEKYASLKWREVLSKVEELTAGGGEPGEEGAAMTPMQALRQAGYSEAIIDYPTSPLGLHIYRKTGRPLTSGFVGDAAKLLNISWDEARRLMKLNADVLNGVQEGNLEKAKSGLSGLESALGGEL